MQLDNKQIQILLDKMANAIFGALAEKDIQIDTAGVITTRVTIDIGDEEELHFDLKLMNRVMVSVSPANDDTPQLMGFKV